MWTIGISFFSQAEKNTWNGIRRAMTAPAVIAVYFGIARMLTQFNMPAFIDKAISSLGNRTTPLAMVLVGSILGDTNLKEVFEPKAFYLVFIRQIFLPLLCLIGLKFLSIDALIKNVSIIISGMPIASTTAILAQKYKADVVFASKCLFLSTISSTITVPLLSLLL